MSASTTWPAVRTKPAPRPGEEAGDDELRKRAGFRAPQIAEGRDDASEREGGPAPEPVAELAGRHGDDEPRESVDGDREADRGGGDAERLRVEGERRHDAAEAELVDRDEDAHPDEDAPLEGHVSPARFRPAHRVTPFVRTSSPRPRRGAANAPLSAHGAAGGLPLGTRPPVPRQSTGPGARGGRSLPGPHVSPTFVAYSKNSVNFSRWSLTRKTLRVFRVWASSCRCDKAPRTERALAR